MASFGWLLFFTSLPYIALCDLIRIETVLLGGDNGLRSVLFHAYQFPESSDVASQLVSTLMDYNIELSSLVASHVADIEYEDEANKEDCYRKVAELPWISTIESNLTAHLAGVLTNLVEKDADFADQLAKCGKFENECTDHFKSQALREINSFGKRELYNVAQIKSEYLRNIGEEMDNCVYI